MQGSGMAGLKSFLRLPESEYDTRTILRWLWKAWKGNRLQAVLNAAVGLLEVIVSLVQVTAVKSVIDAASGANRGIILSAVHCLLSLAILYSSLHFSYIRLRIPLRIAV